MVKFVMTILHKAYAVSTEFGYNFDYSFANQVSDFKGDFMMAPYCMVLMYMMEIMNTVSV
jgi:hypothetical protein